jgi:hypothetical protein
MTVRLGDTAPDFVQDPTAGPIHFTQRRQVDLHSVPLIGDERRAIRPPDQDLRSYRRLRPTDIAIHARGHIIPPSTGKAPVEIFGDAALLWLIELSPTERHLSVLGHQAITTTNIVIYDRALEPIVAATLPLGGYAEPAAFSSETPEQATERCLRFLLDGWSVVRLIDADITGGQRARRVRHLSERLTAANFPDELTVLLFMNGSDGTCREIETDLRTLETRISAASREEGLTIVLGAIGALNGGRDAVLSNGLAG